MVKSEQSDELVETKRDKTWLYEQYYVGERDEENRRNGYGVNNWSGAKSVESYDGLFTRNTLHGTGEYRWRHLGEDGIPFTYEGHFYNNNMHGYGLISFPDGRTFRGLFNNNMRWGPGIQAHTNMREDVGLWSGTQLIRLAWRPTAPNIIPDFMSINNGRKIVEEQRRLLSTALRNIGEFNSAIDLLKSCGADPRSATEKWKKLYPTNCTDMASHMCQTNVFDRDYYKENIEVLEEVSEVPQYESMQDPQDSTEPFRPETYFAWSNNNVTINMMKHCYQHEKQRDKYEVDIGSILSGPRKVFKTAGNHEADCRALLLTSYLGYTANVAHLINKQNVNPNITDIQGNSALMYATCGDQVDAINFLIDACADVDFYNDSCCTALGIALIRYTCATNDILPCFTLQALIPPPPVPAQPPIEPRALEWNMTRELTSQGTTASLVKSSSKTARNLSQKKIKSLLSVKDPPSKRKNDLTPKSVDTDYDSDDSLSENKRVYSDANREYLNTMNEIFQQPNLNPVFYLFDFNNMIMEVDALEDETKKSPDKNPKKVISKVIKDTIKTSKEAVWTGADKAEQSSENSIEKQRNDMLARMKLTILELMSRGANPQSVRCPHPALVMAIASNNSDLIRELSQYGADVNEVYPQFYGYSPLDIAVSRKFTFENLDIVRALLESGANAKRTIYCEQSDTSDVTVYNPRGLGPTLLHAVLARKIENEIEEDIRRQLLGYLLDYNCNSTLQYKGRSAIDMVMSININLFDVFIRNPKTDLNSIINEQNQSALVKMFSIPFFKTVGTTEKTQTLTDLLLFGADPLLPCQNGEDRYENIFVFAKLTLYELENTQAKSSSPTDQKGKKAEKPKKDEKLASKSLGKMVTDDKEDYRQAIALVTECARILHIRWLQGKLIKELIITINKYKHRQWNVILSECKNKKRIGLWITPYRCLEIWNILASTRNKVYKENRILKHLLSIVTFLSWRFYDPKKDDLKPGAKVTAIIRNLIDKDVCYLLREYKATSKMTKEEMQWKRRYVQPELDNDDQKFDVCFECALPFNEEIIKCYVCKLVSFCSYECMKENIGRINCHPCSEDLKNKYFKSPKNSFLSSMDSHNQGVVVN